MQMDSGDMMFVWAVIAAMAVFAVTLFSVSWTTNSRK
jgi:Tfp pilus assembly protein FimT